MSLPVDVPCAVGVRGPKVAKLGVLKLGLSALAKALPHGDWRFCSLESCLGVSKTLLKKEGDVGVRVGVGGPSPES